MSWRGRGGCWGPWPGRGPFSHLPPWERPGWLYGRGACGEWTTSHGRSYGPYGIPPARPEDEIAALEESKKYLQEELKGLEARIQELQKPQKKEST